MHEKTTQSYPLCPGWTPVLPIVYVVAASVLFLLEEILHLNNQQCSPFETSRTCEKKIEIDNFVIVFIFLQRKVEMNKKNFKNVFVFTSD